MTAIAMSAPTSVRLRLTVRGRRVLAALVALPLAAGCAVAAIGGGAALASSAAGAASESFRTVTVQAGDSLWSIAEEVAPSADPRDVVDAITRLNALDGAGLVAGEELAIPTEYISN